MRNSASKIDAPLLAMKTYTKKAATNKTEDLRSDHYFSELLKHKSTSESRLLQVVKQTVYLSTYWLLNLKSPRKR